MQGKPRVLIDWNQDGSYGGAYDDVSAYLIDTLKAFRGRAYPSPLTGRAKPGDFSCTLENRSGLFSSHNEAGGLFGYLGPGRKLRYQLGVEAHQMYAAQFTAANSEYLSIADNAALSMGDVAMDICGWVYADTLPSSGNTMGLVGKWASGNLEYLLFLDNTAGTIRFKFSVRNTANSTTTTVTASTFGTPSVSTFYFVHAYHDPTANTIGIQVNDGTADTAATSGGVRDSNAAFEIGRHTAGSYYNGRLDEIGIWKHATTRLTTAQTTWLYNSGTGRSYSELGVGSNDGAGLLTNLVGYWQLEEASGSRADSKGSNTLTDNATVTQAAGLAPTYYYTRWTGYVKDLVPDRRGNVPVVRLTGKGVLSFFENKKIDPAASSGAATGTIVGTILDTVGWSATERSIDTGSVTTSRWYVSEKDVTNALREMEDTELGFLYELEDGYIAYESRDKRRTGVYLTSQATYSDEPDVTLPYVSIQQLDAWRDIINVVKPRVTPYTVNALAVLWTLSETPTLSAGQSRSWFANYPNPLSQLGAAYVDAWTTPVVGTDITQTGVSNSDIAVSVSKFATAMKITVTNNHATNTATLTLVQARGTAVIKGNTTSVISEDTGSQTEFGLREYRVPSTWLANTNDAQDYADLLIATYSDLQLLLYAKFVANLTQTLYEDLMGRSISDRVSIVAAEDRTALGITEDMFVESVDETIYFDQGCRHEVVFGLSAAAISGDFWILGTSTLDTDTFLGA